MPDDRFYDLASRYLDGATTEAEAIELSGRLQADPEARLEMARLVNQHGALRWAFVPAEEATPVPQPKVVTRRSARRRRSARSPSSALPWIGAAAAALFLILVAAVVGRPSRPAVTPPPLVVRPPEPSPELTKEPGSFVRPPAEPPAPADPPAPLEPPRAPAPSAPPVSPEPARPVATPPPAPVSAPAPVPEPGTKAAPAAIATLEAVEGSARLGELAPGAPILAEQRLATPEGVRARVRFGDGTRVELSPATEIALSSRPGPHVALRAGEIVADVEKQPADRPFTVGTPHGHLRVLGTRFTVRTDKAETRLDVHEGKVRLSRADGAASVDVPAGHFAVAAPGTPLAARPVPPASFRISFGPSDGSAPPDYAVDDGSPFDEKRGWGWSRDLRKNSRLRPGKAPVLQRRHVAGGSALAADRWEIAVPNGRYSVSLSCGDSQNAQGPHRVLAEGLVVVNDAMTLPGKHVIVERAVVEVKDGRLTLEVGALGTNKADRDGDTDTVLNWIVLQQLR